MATHSSVLAWEISWTEEPGGLQSRGHKESDTTEHTGDIIYKQINNKILLYSMWNYIQYLTMTYNGK